MPRPEGPLKTSSPRSSPPGAAAQDGAPPQPRPSPPEASPARSSSPLSSSATADDAELSSPVLPPLPAPQLPERALEHLRSPESPTRPDQPENSRYVTASWGSPYPSEHTGHLRQQSYSSELSDVDDEDSPLHHLEIDTPFLRPAPLLAATNEPEPPSSSLTGSAAVLANRARRPPRGITEDWIRQHTTKALSSEHRHWFSDGTDDSEHSSLSGSASGEEPSWYEETDPITPRAPRPHTVNPNGLTPQGHPRTRSSNETLKQAVINRRFGGQKAAKMESIEAEKVSWDEADSPPASETPARSTTEPEVAPQAETPAGPDDKGVDGTMTTPVAAEREAPATPQKPAKPAASHTPRLKKKVPWKGKNIMVLLPRDEERGQPGNAPMPLDPNTINTIMREWAELGYNVRGFDLEGSVDAQDNTDINSQSRHEWPSFNDMARERADNKYPVTLPDLNAWKDYVNELQEAKLRALGVSLAEEEPEPQLQPEGMASASPAPGMMNQYPPLPFSPPIPTSSAGANSQQPGFPFQAPFLSGNGSSATQSPGIPSVASPVSFNAPQMGKYNPRASISISPHELPFFSGQPSPHGWNPQMLLQQQLGHRAGSPSMMMSPSSPFQRDNMSPAGMHQRHQSLQFPMLPHQQLQRQDSARASPRLQDLREEVEDELQSNPYDDKSPVDVVDTNNHFIRHNASNSLQREINDAEYHLEEQFNTQLDEPDYNPPHNEQRQQPQPLDGGRANETAHARGPSVHFSSFANDSDDGPKLHHPQPHSRGHSLSQQAYFDNNESRNSLDNASANNMQQFNAPGPAFPAADESYEIETNPSNLGTPVGSFDFMNQMHQKSLSNVSNPWADEPAAAPATSSKASSRKPSHSSKPSFSKLNAGAAEFKFNPGSSSFTPGSFVFGSSANPPTSFPVTFQGADNSSNHQAVPSMPSNHASFPSIPSVHEMQQDFHPQAPSLPEPEAPEEPAYAPEPSYAPEPAAEAPVVPPSKGTFDFGAPAPKKTFDFAASGPKFNPGAASFTPLGSFAPSLASPPTSGTEGRQTRPGSIFSNIDLNLSDIVKPAKKSKAIPIVRPSEKERKSPVPVSAAAAAAAASVSAAGNSTEDQDGRLTDTSRVKKKFRDNNSDGDDVPLFAEPTPEPEPQPQTEHANQVEEEREEEEEAEADKSELPEDKPEEHGSPALADTTLASTVISESTDGKVPSESNDNDEDTKTTTSPSGTSPDQDKGTWAPFEFRNSSEIQSFNDARPFGEVDPNEHKKNLSATAQPFVPGGGFMFGSGDSVTAPFDPMLKLQPTSMALPEPESEEDRAGSPTPGPDSQLQNSAAREPTPEEPRPRVVSKGLATSRFASPPKTLADSPPPLPKPAGLAASRFAGSPSPVSETTDNAAKPTESSELLSFEPLPVSPPSVEDEQPRETQHGREPTFEDIDAVMRHMEREPSLGIKKNVDSPQWQPSPARGLSPARNMSVAAVTHSPPVHLQPPVPFRSDAPSPSPRQYRTLPQEAAPRASTEMEDPFVDPPRSAVSQGFDGSVNRLNASEAVADSEWDDAFSASEQGKLEQRVKYFDGHVNDLVSNLLASRLDPLEKTLDGLHHALGTISRRAASSRRDGRSVSAEIQESDADDEDDETPHHRSLSPRRDRRLEQIRIAVMEAMDRQHNSRALEQAQVEPTVEISGKEESLPEQLKSQLTETIHGLFMGDELRNLVDHAVEKRAPPPPAPVIKDDDEANNKMAEMQAKIVDLEQRLRSEEGRAEEERNRVRETEDKLRSEEQRTEEERNRLREVEQKLRVQEEQCETETNSRRVAEDRSVELRRQLEQAETKVEVEIMNRSVFDQRIHDLEDRLKTQEGKTETELSTRREAEDRLSEIQRLLRISSEEEDRLRSVLEERDDKLKALQQSSGKNSMRLTLLEADKSNGEQTQGELKNRLANAEAELKESRQESRHWRSEAEQAREAYSRQNDDFHQAVNETKHLHKLIDTLGVQLEENERIRDNWRAKFVGLQDDMAHAAREITEENSRRTKKEQALVARLEVLDARVQAEARTRERLEVECERLEGGERAGMRAVAECKRLEGIIGELRNENHTLGQSSLRLQRELEDAKDAAATEVQRAQNSVENELEAAHARVEAATTQIYSMRAELEDEVSKVRAQLDNVKLDADTSKAHHDMMLEAAQTSKKVELDSLREELEEEITKVRAQLDQVRLDADTAKAHHEMMLEEAQTTKKTEVEALISKSQIHVEDLTTKHQNHVEDLEARYERQIHNVTEDAQRNEQHLMERLSLSSSKTEHLQDRITHLEEKVQIAQEAAKAAAQAASQASKAPAVPAPAPAPESIAQATPATQTKQLAKAMELPEKISPQALRESIMVLQEQLQAREQRIEELEQSVSKLDPEAPSKISKRDDEITWLRELLAVRHSDLQDIINALSADNFDVETVKDAAIRLKANLQMEEQERERAMNGGSNISLPSILSTPRVAQAVGPLAAAWGNWKKANQARSATMASPRHGRNVTPSKAPPAPAQRSNSTSSGLMTPPASHVRNMPAEEQSQAQPTAFGATGRRFTAEQFANRDRDRSVSARQAEKMPAVTTPPPRQDRKQPVTPPMMASGSYDADAQMEDFDDASFFDD